MGKIINNGIVYGGGSSVELDATLSIEGKAADAQAVGKALGIEITQAEYDALSEEEKNNGIYWVTDGAGGTDGNNIDIVDNLESTDTDKVLSANQGNVIKNMLGDQVTFSLSGATLIITTK
jgi:hypothetical protein